MQTHISTLSDGWHWKERDATYRSVWDEALQLTHATDSLNSTWTAAQTFPSEIHVELLKAGHIPDPFIGFNEHKVQWVGEREWLYACTFSCELRHVDALVELFFEGLDTICDIYLNGIKILSSDNMFRSYLVPIEISAARNTLLLHFKSAKLIAKELEKTHGRVRAGSTNLGDPSRVYVRKAQYDWSLVIYTTRVRSVHTHAYVSPLPALSPSLKVDIVVVGLVSTARSAEFVLKDYTTGQIIKEERILLSLDRIHGSQAEVVSWNLENMVELWWPVKYGKQSMYVLEVVLFAEDNTILDQTSKRIGFRRIELVQEPLQGVDQYGKGTTFLFEVNGIRMFMGGSNWIPAHNFLTELTEERYRAWLTLLRDGNQNMVRLWGGGVYEPDVFYDICDELGILVWQDFQFACGVYPVHSEFVANVKAEAEDNVIRLRHHPAIVLFCGNNEDYQQVLQWGGIADLPARLIYESVLPSVVAEHTDPLIPYHRGSPYGGEGWDTADPTVGDIHQWDIWAGKERPWQEYGTMGGRFISEFGIPSMPDIRTVDYWLDGNKNERWAQSKLMAQHNKAGNHERRFAVIMNENFRLTSDLETHIYNTQLMQSEAISLAFRMWRREWKGRGKEYTSGALVWQLNDCWPVTSWAIADYFLRPKPAYFAIARELAPLTVGVYRVVTKNRDNDRPKQFYEFGAFRSIDARIEVWATNGTLKAQEVRLVLHCVDLISDWTYNRHLKAVLHPNQSTELLSIPCPCPPLTQASDPNYLEMTRSYSVVVAARLVDLQSGEVLARYADWPQPFRHVDIPDPGLRIDVEGEEVSIEVERPVKGLLLSVDGEGEEVKWSDNALDVIPGDGQVVLAKGLSGRAIKIAYLGKEKASKL
ncbi:hypothetical protein AcW2_007777 [Taiwanofungus camphoratus]|nr:hypothetical protein AcW2_007777 [Antrodia cinnamomea]